MLPQTSLNTGTAVYLVSLVHEVLARVEVEAGLPVAVVDVDPGLQVGDILQGQDVSGQGASQAVK